MAVQQRIYSVIEAAKLLGVHDSRVRQLCIEHEIGQKIGPVRVLTEADIEKLKNIPDKRLRANRENS